MNRTTLLVVFEDGRSAREGMVAAFFWPRERGSTRFNNDERR